MIWTAEEFRNYVESHKAEFIGMAFLLFISSMGLNHINENKGKVVIPKSTYSETPLKRWKRLTEASDFAQLGDIGTIEVDSYLAQFRDVYFPTELERMYKGEMRKKGQDPHDFPFSEWFTQEAAKAIAQQMERTVWQAKVDTGGDAAADIYDGILEQTKAAITAGTLTPVALGTPVQQKSKDQEFLAGEIGIINLVEQLYDNLPEAIKMRGVKIWLSPALMTMYSRSYRDVYRDGVTIDPDLNRPVLDSTNSYAPAVFHPCPGMGDSQRIIIAETDNLYYTYDVEDDATKITTEKHFNGLYMFSDVRIGSGILQPEDAWMTCNELV